MISLKDFDLSKFKFDPEMKLFAPQNRGFLFVSCVVSIVVIVVLIFFFSKKDKGELVNTVDIAVVSDAASRNADSQVSDEYKKSIQEVNQEAHESAKQNSEGASLPILYHDRNGTQSTDIANCGCTFDDAAKAAMIEELRRLGFKGVETVDALKVGYSDIFIRTDGKLVDNKDIPLQFDGQEISTDDSGLIVYSNSNLPVSTSSDDKVYLSNDGSFYDSSTSTIRLNGRLLTSDGMIYLGNGQLANRPGNMSQVGTSDVYITKESQLATIDSKPIYHSEKFVYHNKQDQLINQYSEGIQWGDKGVYLQDTGLLTDQFKTKFLKDGILFSYDGILIDNNGRLTEQLNNFERFGDSDIFKDDSGRLVDSFNKPITHYGYKVKVGVNNILISQIGEVKTASKEIVSVADNGRLTANAGVVLSGSLKNSVGVAFDKYDHLLSRQNKLQQISTSDIYVSADRLLSDVKGKPLQFSKKDVFQDISRFVSIKSKAMFSLTVVEL